jgi:AmiR/NasT family two-component response regulator
MTTTQTAEQLANHVDAVDDHVLRSGSLKPAAAMLRSQSAEIERLRETVHQAQDALEELQKGRTFKSKHLAVAAINKCKELT